MNATTRQEQKESIVIREFNPDDLAHIQQMFVDATMTGRGSPYQKGMTIYNISRIVYPAIGSIAFLQMSPLFLALHNDVLRIIPWIQAGIGALCLLGTIYIWYYRRRIQRLFRVFLDEGLTGELGDVVNSYNLRVTESGACVPTGPSGFWVAEIGGEIAGCVGLNKNLRTDPTVGDVRRLFVAPAHQGKGVAEKLMAALTSHARDHKLHALELTTSDYNQTALRFYHRVGWKATGRTDYHGLMIIVLRRELAIDRNL